MRKYFWFYLIYKFELIMKKKSIINCVSVRVVHFENDPSPYTWKPTYIVLCIHACTHTYICTERKIWKYGIRRLNIFEKSNLGHLQHKQHLSVSSLCIHCVLWLFDIFILKKEKKKGISSSRNVAADTFWRSVADVNERWFCLYLMSLCLLV